MIPHFTNTTAFWALLAIPLITAIHFLQHKTKTQATATLFLLEALVPEAHEGNAWDRLRASRSFWMQILAVLLLTWVLAAPARPCTPWISGSRAKEHMTWPLPCAPPQPLPVQRASRA